MEQECDIYACRNKQETLNDVTAVIDEVVTPLEVCDEHKDFFESMAPEHYLIGRTYTQEVEIRAVPSQPAVPPAEPEV